jgi:integrase
MASRGIGEKIRKNILGALRFFMGWIKRRKVIKAIPEFDMPEGDEHAPKIITRAQQEAVLANIPIEERGPYLVACYMGLRPGEIRALSVGCVHLEGELPFILVSRAMKGTSADAVIRSTKTKRWSRVSLAPAVIEWLREFQPADASADDPLFINPRTGKRLSHWALRDRWVTAAKAAGVNAGLYEGTKHSFATDALARTGDAWAVQKILGHSDERSSKLYAKLSDRALAAVVGASTLH